MAPDGSSIIVIGSGGVYGTAAEAHWRPLDGVVHPDDLRPAGKIIARYAVSAGPFGLNFKTEGRGDGRIPLVCGANIPLGYTDGKSPSGWEPPSTIDDRKKPRDALNNAAGVSGARGKRPDIVLRFDRELRLSMPIPRLRACSRPGEAPCWKKGGGTRDGDDIARPGRKTSSGSSAREKSARLNSGFRKSRNGLVRGRLAPELSRAGAVESVLAICRNVTERILAREKRKLYKARLEHSNKDLEAFAAIASHDLQEPIRKVQPSGTGWRRSIAEARRGGARLHKKNAGGVREDADHDRSLLNFSRLGSTVRPWRTPTLGKSLKQVVRDLEVAIEQKKGRVEIGTCP